MIVDDERRKQLIDYLASNENEMLHVVDGQIRIRPEWTARLNAAHLADTANYDWCDCPLHDPRP